MPKNLPLPPFDLPVTGDDRALAYVLTGDLDERTITRSAQHIRQYVDAEIATDEGLAKALESYKERHGILCGIGYFIAWHFIKKIR